MTRGFRRVVVGVVRVADDAVGGCHVQDDAAVVRHHVARGRLRDVEDAAQVHGQHPVPFLGRDVEKVVTNADAGIVDDDVEAAQADDHITDRMLYPAGVADISLESPNDAGQFVLKLSRSRRDRGREPLPGTLLRQNAPPSPRQYRWRRR